MLGIFGKKSDHPLADVKTAQELVDGIPKNDAQNALQDLTGWMETIIELADEFRVDHEFAVLRMFDEAAHPYVRKLLRDYFAVHPLSKFQENRLWTVLNNFFTTCELAHHDVLTRLNDSARATSALKLDAALMNARGIAALTGRLKMAVARYALVEPELWQHLAEFYAHASSQGYLNDRVPAYAGTKGNTSVAQEFSALLTWYGVSAGVLSPLQEHITERLISYAGASLLVYDQYNANSMFVFDLSQPTPPMHLTSDATLHPALRYVVMGEAVVKLGDLGKTLKKGIVPDDLDFCDASYEAGMVLDVLQRLVGIMKQPPPTRRNPRRKINVSLKVANGFHRMLEKADAGLNFFNPDDTEVWEVEDISVTGFRSVIPAARADGIKIGSLVGSKPENVPHWGSGIVRRLSRDESGNLRVGVEVLSAQIVGVTLVQDGRPVEQGGQLALYLKRPADASGEAWVLMRPGSFSPQRSLNMIVGSTEYLLMPTALVESGDDYDLARFRLVEHETVTV